MDNPAKIHITEIYEKDVEEYTEEDIRAICAHHRDTRPKFLADDSAKSEKRTAKRTQRPADPSVANSTFDD